MPGFHWYLEQDITLCIEVTKQRPQKPADWDEIAKVLNVWFSTEEKKVELKGRGCREHLALLLKKYKEEDANALKRYVGVIECVFQRMCLLMTF